jgi:hypothetical protein
MEGIMKKEDREFLKELQHEMLTQDTVGQANPRFWVVMEEKKECWVDEDDSDGIFVYSNDDGETCFEGGLDKLVDWVQEFEGIESCKYDVCFVEFNYEDEEYAIGNADDLQNFLDEYNEGTYTVGYYRNREEIAQDTMFLTLRECKEHIKSNRHHYKKNAHPYAMTAWRSPQVVRLYEILEKTDWDNI